MRAARRPRPGLGMCLAAVLACQLVLWIAVGRRSLPKQVPHLIVSDFGAVVEETIAREHIDFTPFVPLRPRAFKLCAQLSRALTEGQQAELARNLRAWNIYLLEAGQALPREYAEEGVEIEEVCLQVRFDTPAVAELEYGRFGCPLCSWGVSHRMWFLLGFWIDGGPTSSWVS